MEPLTTQMILVMAMIGLAVFLFITELIRVDVVAILMMVTLPLLHLVTPKEAFIGLSSNAVVSIIAVIIIGAGLDRTGLVNKLVKPILRIAGSSTSRIITSFSMTIAIISSFMQNIGAAALFLPAVLRISKATRISPSRLLMPIGFSAILGGTVTLVGSSPLILLNDLMIPFNLKPFHLFDVTPIGLALVVSGISCFILFGRFILPQGHKESQQEKHDDDKDAGRQEATLFELKTPADFTHYREPVTLSDLGRRYVVRVLAMVEPPDHLVTAPALDATIRSDCDLLLSGEEKDIRRMAEQEGIAVKEHPEVFKELVSEHRSATEEAVVAPRSSLVGKTLRETDFQHRFNLIPLAIQRQGEMYRVEIEDIVLDVGDVIVLFGSLKSFQALKKEGSLLFSTPSDVDLMRPEKAGLSAFWLAVSLTLIMAFKIQLSVALMTGALGMILTRVLTIDEAYQSVDWRTVFLLGGLIPLGIATEKTGTAAWIAHAVLNAVGVVSPIVLLSVIGLLATVFTLVISNVGATVLLVPLVVNMAIAAHTDPRMAALVVGLATSNSFLLPTHQVNALYMGPGQYRSVDFMKAGALVSVVFLVTMIAMIYFFYGVSN